MFPLVNRRLLRKRLRARSFPLRPPLLRSQRAGPLTKQITQTQDLVFNFYKVYAILDEVFLAGEIEETSKAVILDRLEFLEKLD